MHHNIITPHTTHVHIEKLREFRLGGLTWKCKSIQKFLPSRPVLYRLPLALVIFSCSFSSQSFHLVLPSKSLTRSRRWSLQGPPYFQFSTTCNHIYKAHLLSIFLFLDHHKPDWSSGKKRKHKRCYFLCYELEKVKKEEVDFWTSRHERVKG